MSRGVFQSIHVVMVDGPDFQALTPEARFTALVLKLTLGASGIAVVPAWIATLTERTGYSAEVVEAALAELTPKWVRAERNVAWLVDGLKHNPNLSATNVKHRRSVQQHVSGLPRLGVCGEFVSHYAAEGWFPDGEWAAVEYPPPSDSLSIASPMGTEGHPSASLSTSYFVLRTSQGDQGKKREEPPEPESFAAIWAAYPKRGGGNSRKMALRAFRARLAKGADPDAILAGVQQYAEYVRAVGDEGTKYVMQAATFLGPDEHYAEPWSLPKARAPKPGTQEWRDAELEARAREVVEQTEQSTAWLDSSAGAPS